MLRHLRQIKPLKSSYDLEKVRTNEPDQNQYALGLTLQGQNEQAQTARRHFVPERYQSYYDQKHFCRLLRHHHGLSAVGFETHAVVQVESNPVQAV